ncbi:harmonin-like isoform X2 [Acipenser ruthenus]|uniref:harmonin-like isoform X2 n=1 Tax=Acipenser ruthenus TaxID=7906 RepID=UPI0027413F8A|nr:harmonin-like isoform X2 [Acipenser ruthenus]
MKKHAFSKAKGLILPECSAFQSCAWQCTFLNDPLTTSQKGKEKQKKKSSKTETQEQKKNKKELEFEQKLAKEKEEMFEREKQLKINRLVQEVSETEREDMEESEKVQHWVERLCQTRLEQISSAENESPEVILPCTL